MNDGKSIAPVLCRNKICEFASATMMRIICNELRIIAIEGQCSTINYDTTIYANYALVGELYIHIPGHQLGNELFAFRNVISQYNIRITLPMQLRNAWM